MLGGFRLANSHTDASSHDNAHADANPNSHAHAVAACASANADPGSATATATMVGCMGVLDYQPVFIMEEIHEYKNKTTGQCAEG